MALVNAKKPLAEDTPVEETVPVEEPTPIVGSDFILVCTQWSGQNSLVNGV